MCYYIDNMTIYLNIIFFIFGSIFASFLNAFEYRLKNNLNWKNARSECVKCAKKIKFYDNIPIISFLLLKGRCRNCREKISWQYPLVELITGLLFVFIFNYFYFLNAGFDVWLNIFLNCFILLVLIFIFLYDLKYMEVSDFVVLGSSAVVFFCFWFFDIRTIQSMFVSIIIGVSFFLLQFLISKGKWIGGGDIRIAFFMGVLFNWQNLLLALWLAYIIGAIIAIFLLIKNKKNMKSEIAFGTFLTLASFITLYWGDFIINWYLNFIR